MLPDAVKFGVHTKQITTMDTQIVHFILRMHCTRLAELLVVSVTPTRLAKVPVASVTPTRLAEVPVTSVTPTRLAELQ